ncbi:MAG TPA: enolase C-terminal domain-like protein [Burkholderiales bacterium]|nr:enolase C-terminal domain-like protein [Burkholderiales bacterium]
MKITDVTITLFAWENLPPRQFGRHTGRMAGGRSELGLVTISTDDGVEGHSFLGSSSRGASYDAASLIRFLKPLLIGQNPFDREGLYQQMWARSRNTTLRCIGAVDVALWDLAGKVAGLPIHRMLGSFRESIAAYASSEVLPSKEAYAEEAVRIREAGFHAYKIHPPAVWQQDIEICRHVRKAVGQSYRLMLDSTWSYNYVEALRVGRALEELDYCWYEDPLDADDITNYVKLRQKLDIPILATEYTPGGLQAFAPWITLQATDFLRGDVAVKGGITALVKIAHLAEAFHMNLEVHHGGNSLNNVANLHVILAIPNTEYFEVLLPDATQKYGLVQDITVARDGTVRPPDGAGLGANIDFDLIARKKIEILR